MTSNFIALQAASNGGMINIIMIVVLIGIFYFFMIRPQQKRQKETKKFRDGLSNGDRVVTAGGIHGRIREIKDLTVVLEVSPNVKITVEKSMIYPSAVDAQNDQTAVTENNNK